MINSISKWLSCLLVSLPVLLSAQQQLYKEASFVKGKDTLNYRIMWPENFSESNTYPIVLFLHGSGERGNDNHSQLIHGSTLFTSAENR